MGSHDAVDVRNPVPSENSGRFSVSTGAGFLPSTVSPHHTRLICWGVFQGNGQLKSKIVVPDSR